MNESYTVRTNADLGASRGSEPTVNLGASRLGESPARPALPPWRRLPADMAPARRLSLLAALVCLLVASAGPGCRSVSGPAEASFASVTIENHSPAEIANATAQVFGADGYRGGISGPGQMIYEKGASKATTLSREGLTSTYYGAQTINRVRLQIVALSDTTARLQCQAFVVTGGSDPFFQDEVPLTNLRSGPYQSLLNKVAKLLKEPAGATNSISNPTK
jgi:hypothetical protein